MATPGPITIVIRWGGRQLIRKDVGDVDCQYFYEKTTGRLHTLDHGYIQAQFEYDTQGRLLRTTCRDLSAGASLTTELGYDDLGRETLRTLTPNDQPPRILRQTWQADDRLQSRHLQTADGRSLLLEEFGYDQRGRLELHLCSGDELPRDRHGNEIIEQLSCSMHWTTSRCAARHSRTTAATRPSFLTAAMMPANC
ncbi:hypothetical protein [Pseudomonas fluorescens]|uniref:hypothetical protein n=1 Tax=Pseudomonas fluorescens TaxID=294 RepID=UPI001C45207E|nr:hypothetical protein [Pseudomonas fluorescens]QXN53062.1 hypothetical protein KW062_14000 [Pseudomonas fluorescens]WSO27383.1 hypothetical protein VUJ50_14075 [Pseudomonas fluorescens]